MISGNGGEGVLITDSGTTGNVVSGNAIGTDASGSSALPNTYNGVWIGSGASNNTIGGTTAGEISTKGLSTGSAVVMAIKSPDMKFTTSLGRDISKSETKAGQMLANESLKNITKNKIGNGLYEMHITFLPRRENSKTPYEIETRVFYKVGKEIRQIPETARIFRPVLRLYFSIK